LYFEVFKLKVLCSRSTKAPRARRVAQKKLGGANNCLSVCRLLCFKHEDKREFCERQVFRATQGIGKADVRPGCPFLRPFFWTSKKGTKETFEDKKLSFKKQLKNPLD
jgi:hypothetical protein